MLKTLPRREISKSRRHPPSLKLLRWMSLWMIIEPCCSKSSHENRKAFPRRYFDLRCCRCGVEVIGSARQFQDGRILERRLTLLERRQSAAGRSQSLLRDEG